MLKFNTIVKDDLGIQLKRFIGEAGLVFAGKVVTSFKELLADSPQRYGSYVSNWKVRAGRAGGSGEYVEWPKRDDWYMVGSTEAISSAMGANAGFSEAFRSYLGATKAAFPNVTVWNPTPHWKQAEYGPLRAEQSDHFGAFAAFQRRLGERLASPTRKGDGMWEFYLSQRL